MHASQRKIIPISGKIGIGAKRDGTLSIIDVKQLLQVKNLNAVTWLLTADNNVVLVCTDLAPLARSNTGSLGKTTKVSELSSRGNFCKSSSVPLGNDCKFAPIITDPSPRA